MDKDLKEMLKELHRVLGDMLDDKKIDKIEKIEKAIEKAHKEDATISIKKYKDGRADTEINGSKLALLITLAGLEKSILEKLDCCEGEFELIKVATGVKEVD